MKTCPVCKKEVESSHSEAACPARVRKKKNPEKKADASKENEEKD